MVEVGEVLEVETVLEVGEVLEVEPVLMANRFSYTSRDP
jgi:hypothetical protein